MLTDLEARRIDLGSSSDCNTSPMRLCAIVTVCTVGNVRPLLLARCRNATLDLAKPALAAMQTPCMMLLRYLGEYHQDNILDTMLRFSQCLIISALIDNNPLRAVFEQHGGKKHIKLSFPCPSEKDQAPSHPLSSESSICSVLALRYEACHYPLRSCVPGRHGLGLLEPSSMQWYLW